MNQQEVHDYQHFSVDWVDVDLGDKLKAEHTVRSIRRMRHWKVLRSFCAVGICVEGLVIREDQLVLAGPEDVKLVFDDAPKDYDPLGWSQDQLRKLCEDRSRGILLTEL